MSVDVGETYGFAFKDGFTALDGVYTITHALSWDSVLLEEVDLYELLYKPAGKSADDVEIDIDLLAVESFYRLESKENEGTVIYAPKGYIVGVPNPAVDRYPKLMVTLNLGVFKDPDVLAALNTGLEQYVKGVFGVTTEAEVTVWGEEWLTNSEYDTIVEHREHDVTGIINYYQESRKKDAQIVKMGQRMAALEQLVRDLHNQLHP